MSEKVKINDKKVPSASPGKAFDLIKSILTVILASIAAAWISHHYKVQEEAAADYAESKKAATTTYYETIDTLGKRNYYALQAFYGFYWSQDEMAHWQQYDNMRSYWNERQYSTLALIRRYFGAAAEQQLQDLVSKFEPVDEKLIAARNAFRDGNPTPKEEFDKAGLEPYLLKLANDIKNFSKSLQGQLKEGQVDIYSPQPPLKKP